MEVKSNFVRSPQAKSSSSVQLYTWLGKFLRDTSCESEIQHSQQKCYNSPFLRLSSIESAGAGTSASSDEDMGDNITTCRPSKEVTIGQQNKSFISGIMPVHAGPRNVQFARAHGRSWTQTQTNNDRVTSGNMFNSSNKEKYSTHCPDIKHKAQKSDTVTHASRTRWKSSTNSRPKVKSGKAHESLSDSEKTSCSSDDISFTHWLDIRMSQAKANQAITNYESKKFKIQNCPRSSPHISSSTKSVPANSYAQALKHGGATDNTTRHVISSANQGLPGMEPATQGYTTYKINRRKCHMQSRLHQHINKKFSDRQSQNFGAGSSKKMSVLHKGMKRKEVKQYDRNDKLQYKKLFEERRAWLNSIKNASENDTSVSSDQSNSLPHPLSSDENALDLERDIDDCADEMKAFHIDVRIKSANDYHSTRKTGQTGSADFTITFLDQEKSKDKDVTVTPPEPTQTESAGASNKEDFSLSGSVHFILNGGTSDASDDGDYDSWSSEEEWDCAANQQQTADDQLLLTVFSLADSLPGLRKVASAPELTDLQQLTRKWDHYYSNNERCKCNRKKNIKQSAKKSVHFPANETELEEVHNMIAWQHAYQAARKGPWEEMARDRSRFQRRLQEVGGVISPCLTPSHRQHMYDKYISSDSVAQ